MRLVITSGAPEVARVLQHRVGGDLVLGPEVGVRARPRQEEPREGQRVGQHQAAAHVALEPCQLQRIMLTTIIYMFWNT